MARATDEFVSRGGSPPPSRTPRWAGAVGTLACAAAAIGQTTLTNLGIPPGGFESYGNAISADGTVVAGTCVVAEGDRAFRWTSASGMVVLGVLTGGTVSRGTGISGDGQWVAGWSGTSSGPRAFRWSAGGGMQNLGLLEGGTNSLGHAISGDGGTVVGSGLVTGSGDRAFRWDPVNGMQNLGLLAGADAAYAYAANGDGSAVAGAARIAGLRRAFRWLAPAGPMQDLGLLPGATASTALALSADGMRAAGWCATPGGDRGFLWTQGSGMIDLGLLTGGSHARAMGLSADGTTVGGECFGATIGTRAIIWSPQLGLRDLNTHLAALGVSLDGWTLETVAGVSADGSALTGTGSHMGAPTAYMVRGLPVCRPTITAATDEGTACASASAPFSVAAASTAPLSYRWQIENPQVPGDWLDLQNDPAPLPGGGSAFATPPDAPSAAIGVRDLTGTFSVRCRVTSTCGSVFSTPATLTVTPCCDPDYNQDGNADQDDIAYLVNVIGGGENPTNRDPDFNQDGNADQDDVSALIDVVAGGACP
jgi:probable HAF family extracellular repeat protein